MNYLGLCLYLQLLLLNNYQLVYSLRLGNDNNLRQSILHTSSNRNEIHNEIQKLRIYNNVNAIVKISRGGSQPIEPNQKYVDYNQFMPPTLGEEEQNHIRRPLHHNNNNYYHRNSQSNMNHPIFHLQQYKKIETIVTKF